MDERTKQPPNEQANRQAVSKGPFTEGLLHVVVAEQASSSRSKLLCP